MWSIGYVADTADDQVDSIETGSVDPVSSVDIEKEDDIHKTSIQEKDETSEVQATEQSDTKDTGQSETEVAIKRVEALVKQMSLPQENEGMFTKSLYLRKKYP